jgi:hypothetical protein
MVVTVVIVAAAGGVVAQSNLAQLGLTETAARNFVLDEIKSPATDRRSAIAIAGTRAFLKLPPSARGPAATRLFAWAKVYVNSPAFTTSYNTYRKERLPTTRQYALTVEEAVKKDLADQLAGVEQLAQAAASMPPADKANMMASVEKARAMFTDPAHIQQRQALLTAERAQESGGNANLIAQVEATTPADPRTLFAKRLREFLETTADVNFSARTINLTGGLDGIEFVDRADRARHWMWREAAIVGPEATTAARAAAEAWLKEIDR